jgi:hypothetical protein
MQNTFDAGSFSEEELIVIKRLLPASYVTLARTMNRKAFLSYASKYSVRLGTLRTILYNIYFGLSKRETDLNEEIFLEEKRLSRRFSED